MNVFYTLALFAAIVLVVANQLLATIILVCIVGLSLLFEHTNKKDGNSI